jgi:hypothetical protein
VIIVVDVHPHNQHLLQDTFGAPIIEGSCVMDCERQVGYVRLDLGPYVAGPDSLLWDGWFNVTPTRSGEPWRGKPMKGEFVQVVRGGGPNRGGHSPRRAEGSSKSAGDRP